MPWKGVTALLSWQSLDRDCDLSLNCAGFYASPAKHEGTSTGLRRMIIAGNSNRALSQFSQRSNRLPESAITITQSCQTTTIHAQQRFVIAAHPHTHSATHTEPLGAEHRLPRYTSSERKRTVRHA